MMLYTCSSTHMATVGVKGLNIIRVFETINAIYSRYMMIKR